MTTNPTSIYGKGISTPLRLTQDGAIAKTSEEQKVTEALIDLLSTVRGERPHVVRNGVLYGVRSIEALFDSIETAQDILLIDTQEAIRVWEPRVILLDVKIERVSSNNLTGLRSHIQFKYRTTNRADNAVVDYQRTQNTQRAQ